MKAPNPEAAASAWQTLRIAHFRTVWGVGLVANLSMWMSDVAAAWLMSALTTSPLWVGLVQTAALLPVLLLGLPSGAVADAVDRRKFLMATQVWLAAVALVLAGCVGAGVVSPPLLLGLTFLNGIGLAMRMPVLTAVVPEVVGRSELPSAMALGAVSINIARIVGPVAAGALIAAAGTAAVFLLNAVLTVASLVILLRWRWTSPPSRLAPESLGHAMRSGLQYVRHSRPLRRVLLRMGAYFTCATALMALLPVLARSLQGGGAWGYTLLVAAMGAGAIAATTLLPALRRRFSRDGIVGGGTLVQVAVLLAAAFTHSVTLALPLMFVAGVAWVAIGNTLSVASQQGLPDWVRARGSSISQATVMGASAAGAALWGAVAGATSVTASLVAAAVALLVAMGLLLRLQPDDGQPEDLTPRGAPPPAAPPEAPAQGHVMMTIEYVVDAARVEAFRALMLGDVRSARLRHGSLRWELLHDLAQPRRFVEIVVDASWTDHLRHFERQTASDLALRERRLSFHGGPQEPQVRRLLLESTVRDGAVVRA